MGYFCGFHPFPILVSSVGKHFVQRHLGPIETSILISEWAQLLTPTRRKTPLKWKNGQFWAKNYGFLKNPRKFGGVPDMCHIAK